MADVPFRDRREAGELLGAHLLERGVADAVVLGLPRGGVVIATEVAKVIGVTADVFVSRKIGHPDRPELGVGAIAEGGDPTYDVKALAYYGLTPDDLEPIVAAERDEVARRVSTYRGGRALPAMGQRPVVLVDDGVATGVTARAAIGALRGHEPSRLIFAAPVGPRGVARQLGLDEADVVILRSPRLFLAVGQWYDNFGQVSDDEVLALLAGKGG